MFQVLQGAYQQHTVITGVTWVMLVFHLAALHLRPFAFPLLSSRNALPQLPHFLPFIQVSVQRSQGGLLSRPFSKYMCLHNIYFTKQYFFFLQVDNR